MQFSWSDFRMNLWDEISYYPNCSLGFSTAPKFSGITPNMIMIQIWFFSARTNFCEKEFNSNVIFLVFNSKTAELSMTFSMKNGKNTSTKMKDKWKITLQNVNCTNASLCRHERWNHVLWKILLVRFFKNHQKALHTLFLDDFKT